MNAVPSPAAPEPRYAWYIVFILMLAYVLSFIDRQVLSLLVQPIRSEFGVSDTQIGLLQGFSFALFYTVLGLPMGRLVDRYDRRRLITAGVALWSLMTVFCGAAASFGMLFFARMGVGVGEAALSPAAFSMISDSFRRERLATALSVYAMGVFIGSGLAFIVGGAVVEAVANRPPLEVPGLGALGAWRLTFLIVGLPGLLLAGVIWRLREPPRRQLAIGERGATATYSIAETVRLIRDRTGSVAGITLGMSGHAICMYGVFAWTPTLFIRKFGWSAAEAGLALGLVVLIAGCAGMTLGGWLTDRWQAKGRADAALRLGVLAAAAIAASGAIIPTLTSGALTVVATIPLLIGLALPVGSLFASLQLIFPNQVRGQASAAFLCVISLVGITLGPLLPPLMSDRWFGGGVGIAPALGVALVAAAAVMACALALGRAPYRRDRARVELALTQ